MVSQTIIDFRSCLGIRRPSREKQFRRCLGNNWRRNRGRIKDVVF